MHQLTTTLNHIRAYNPCPYSWKILLRYLNKTNTDNEPLLLSTIVKSNGLNDALWCCGIEPQYKHKLLLFNIWRINQMRHLIKDQRGITAINYIEQYVNTQSNTTNIVFAWDVIWNIMLNDIGSVTMADAIAAQREKFLEICDGRDIEVDYNN